jgi:hypothetical protein
VRRKSRRVIMGQRCPKVFQVGTPEVALFVFTFVLSLEA